MRTRRAALSVVLSIIAGALEVPRVDAEQSAGKATLSSVLEAPMLAVAVAMVEHRLAPAIDQMMQNNPTASALGDRWNVKHAAWAKARTSYTGRITKVVDLYKSSGEMGRNFSAGATKVAAGAKGDALLATLSSPAARRFSASSRS